MTMINALQSKLATLQAEYHAASETATAAENAERTALIKEARQSLSAEIVGDCCDCPICKRKPTGVQHEAYDARRRMFELDTPSGKRPVDGNAFEQLAAAEKEKARVVDRGVYPNFEIGCTSCPLFGMDEDLGIARLKWTKEADRVTAALRMSAAVPAAQS